MKRLHTILILMTLVSIETSAQKIDDLNLHWQIAGQLPPSPGQTTALGFAGPVAGIYNNVLLVGGGANFPAGMPWEGGQKKYYDEVFAYRIAAGKLLPIESIGHLPQKIAYAASCSTAGGILYAGGENETGISDKVQLVKWDESGQKINVAELSSLPIPLTNAGITVYNNIVYLAGGETINGASRQFYCLDLEKPSAGWKTLQAMPIAVSHMVLIAGTNKKGGMIYMVGGRKKNADGISKLYSSCYAFDIDDNKWVEKRSLPFTLMAGTGVSYNGSGILLFGGDTGKQFHEAETLGHDIQRTNDSTTRTKLVQQKNELQAAHPGFNGTVLLYKAATDEWTIAGKMDYPTQVTTNAITWKDQVFIPGGEIRAGVRTPLIVTATIKRITDDESQ